MSFHPRPRHYAVAAAVVGAALALSACSSSGSGASAGGATPAGATSDVAAQLPSTIRIGYQLVPNGDLVVKNQHLLENAFGDKVKVEWKQFASGGDVNQAIAAGSLDIGLAGSSPVSRGLSIGIAYEVPWIFDVIGSAEALVVKKGIGSLADLKGKTIATPFASTSHYSLLAALQDAGVDAKDVKIIDSEPDAIVAAWKAGQIDGAYVWNPSLAVLQKDGGKTLVDSAQLAAKGKTTYDLAVVTAAFASKYPAAVQSWVNQENAAVKQIQSGDPKAFASIAAEANITPEDAKAQAAGLVFVDAADQAGSDYLAGGLPDNLFAAAQFNKTLGEIDTVKDEQAYHDAVVPTFAAAAK